MCGHVGIAGDLKYKDEALIKRLLLFDFLRGEDGTGLAAVRTNGKDVKLSKVGSHPLELFDKISFKDACNGFQSTAFIGHNRAATRGLKNTANSHPYQYGRITGAHNGTLETDCVKELENLLEEKFDVDSMAIFAAIEKFGIDETIPLLQGAWSLVWHDADDKTLNFLRNDKRPMWRGWSKDCKTMFWASEWKMIDCAVSVVGHNTSNSPVTELWAHPEKGFRFTQTHEDTLYTFKIDELKSNKDEPIDGRVKELKGKEPTPVVSHYHGGHDPFNRGITIAGSGSHCTIPINQPQRTSTTQSKTSSRSILGPIKEAKEKPLTSVVVHLPDSQTDPYGQFITPTEFGELAKDGCSWCSTSLEWGDEGVTVFKRDDIILCAECSGGKTNTGTRFHLESLDLLM